jgi:hypothetical protein
MSGPPAAGGGAAQPPVDHTEELAKKLFVELCGHIYSAPGGTEQGKPQPKAVVAMCFKLAEAFVAGNFEFNSVARAAREAKERSSVDISKVEIDFGSFNKK